MAYSWGFAPLLMTQDLIGILFGDRGYISQALFEKLYEQGLQLITRRKKNMKQQLVKLMDKILLRKRSLIETIGNYTGKIGNALKKSGQVLESSYGWMSEKTSVKTGRLGQIQRVIMPHRNSGKLKKT